VAVIRGINTGGSSIIVQEMYTRATHMLPVHQDQNQPSETASGPEYALCIASGPFSSGAMDAMFAKAASTGCNVIVICGKLTRADKKSAETRAFEKAMQLVIVPSYDSDDTDLMVFPQPRNPAVFEVRSETETSGAESSKPLSVAVVGADVLFGIARDEVQLQRDRDRFSSLCRYCLDQGSFCPLVPPPEGIPLDMTLLDKLNFTQRPNVLVMPSMLKEFAKDVDGTLCVNPRMMQHGQIAILTVRGAQLRVDVERV
jgi:hypothetical protein